MLSGTVNANQICQVAMTNPVVTKNNFYTLLLISQNQELNVSIYTSRNRLIFIMCNLKVIKKYFIFIKYNTNTKFKFYIFKNAAFQKLCIYFYKGQK